MDRDETIDEIKQDFFCNEEVIFENSLRVVKHNSRSDEECEAFDFWLENKDMSDEQLEWFLEYPGDIEKMFYQDPSAQIHKCSLILEAMQDDIIEINGKLKESLAK